MVENVTQTKRGITINVNVSVKIQKNYRVCKKDYIWNPATCSCKNGKYLASIIDDFVITCDQIIEETKAIPINFNEKNATCKKRSIFYLPFY